jgi:hypothetical protein
LDMTAPLRWVVIAVGGTIEPGCNEPVRTRQSG